MYVCISGVGNLVRLLLSQYKEHLKTLYVWGMVIVGLGGGAGRGGGTAKRTASLGHWKSEVRIS